MTLETGDRRKETPRLETDAGSMPSAVRDLSSSGKPQTSGPTAETYLSDPGYFSVPSPGCCPRGTDMCSANPGMTPMLTWSMASFTNQGFSDAADIPHEEISDSRSDPTDDTHGSIGHTSVTDEDPCDEDESGEFERHGCIVDNPGIEQFRFIVPDDLPCRDSSDITPKTDTLPPPVSPRPETEPRKPEPERKHSILDLNEDGDTILHLAIILMLQKSVYHLIRSIKSVDLYSLLRTQNDLFQSPIMLAVLTSQSRIVRMLTVLGSPLGMRDRHGNSALHIACQNGDLRSLKALTQPVEKTDTVSASLLVEQTCVDQLVDVDIHAMNYDGFACLHMAALGGHVDVVDYLLAELGCNINIGDGRSGRTILHHAVEAQNYDMLRFLVANRRKYSLEIDAPTYSGHTPLKLAFGRGLSSVTSLLILLGADGASAESDDEISFE